MEITFSKISSYLLIYAHQISLRNPEVVSVCVKKPTLFDSIDQCPIFTGVGVYECWGEEEM